MKKKGLQLGKHTFEDATPVRSLKDDPDAKYSGYYKHSGYKVDTTIDATAGIPLDYKPMEITANEGEHLIPSQEHVTRLGVQEKVRVIDTKYATFENIAYCELNGILLYYKIAKSWDFKEEGRPGEIKKLYQKYHHESDFIPGADLDFMFHYLYKKKEFESVGSYFRNLRMAEYEEHPRGISRSL